MAHSIIEKSKAPSLHKLLSIQLEETPEHRAFFIKRFSNIDSPTLTGINKVAQMIAALTEGSEKDYAQAYAWFCTAQLEEELFFRRNKRYRLSKFSDAVELVYSNNEYMGRYMRALLMTQLWWSNHTDVLLYYVDVFINNSCSDFSHLEVGPGHGLFLTMAANHESAGKIEAIDVSEASILETQHAISILKPRLFPRLFCQDLFEAKGGQYDNIVLSEILEHLENPSAALKSAHMNLKEGGRVFVNFPINSPAPDHIYNLPTPEDVVSMVREAGFDITSTLFAPASNVSIERARAQKLTISCAVIGTKGV